MILISEIFFGDDFYMLKNLCHQATLTYNGNSTTSNITVGELVNVLSITKTAIRSFYTIGDTVCFIIHIRNTGTSDLNDLIFTDNLGAYAYGTGQLTPLSYNEGTLRYFINGTLQAVPTITVGPPLSITGLRVPAGGLTVIAYETSINNFAPLTADDSITNTVTVTGGGLAIETSDSEIIQPENAPRLSISKSMNPTVIAENGQLTYTFTIQNTAGTPATADDNVIVTDTFDPALNAITVLFNNTAWTAPDNYTYDETTGTFATVGGQITIPAAVYTRDTATGEWITTPGTSVLTVTGTIS